MVPIIDFLKFNGFEIVLFNYAILKDSDAEQIYRKNPPITMTTSWHIPKEVYTMGESCGIIFLHKNESVNASVKMKKLKGSSHPYLNKKGQIRFDFRAPNKSLSLIHSSDDWYSMLNECSPFFSKKSFKNILSKFNERNEEIDSTPIFPDPAYQSMENVIEQSSTNLLLKLRIRILDIIIKEIKNTNEGIKFRSFLIEKNKINYLIYTVEEEISEYEKIAEQEKYYLTEFEKSLIDIDINYIPKLYFQNHNIYTLLNALKIMNVTESYASIDTDELVSIPFYDKWERLLFRTTFFHYLDEETKGIVKKKLL